MASKKELEAENRRLERKLAGLQRKFSMMETARLSKPHSNTYDFRDGSDDCCSRTAECRCNLCNGT